MPIANLSNHTTILGYNDMGYLLVSELKFKGTVFMIQNLLHLYFYVVPGAPNDSAWGIIRLVFMREIVKSARFVIVRVKVQLFCTQICEAKRLLVNA